MQKLLKISIISLAMIISTAFSSATLSAGKTAEVIVPFEYREISAFREGLASACQNNESKFGYINSVGEVVIPFQFDFAGDFSDGMLKAKAEGGYGVLSVSYDASKERNKPITGKKIPLIFLIIYLERGPVIVISSILGMVVVVMLKRKKYLFKR